ncbi:MAG: NCS2 family permease [Verrucomicrobiales bacterium]
MKRFFTRGDIDGFFGLFVDNLLQILLIVVLGAAVCGFPIELIVGVILPGAAVSVIFGNLFYAWQAWRLGKEEGRTDVTALPYGINTPSLFAFIFLIIAPVYQRTQDSDLAWRVGLLACLLSGAVELLCSFFGPLLRKHIPRAALLSALAGIAITFISMAFIFQIFANPVVALLPMFIILANYAGGFRFPFQLPGGLIALVLGVALAWGSRWLGFSFFIPAEFPLSAGLYLPQANFVEAFSLLLSAEGLPYLAVIIPMGLLNAVGSLQNLESAAAAGDRFATVSSMSVNGLGTMIAACFGSPFPTTIYIGHPGWKAMGAGYSYSVINGVVITALCFSGGVLAVLSVVPLEATLGILVWIAIVITAQAFQAVPVKHALAVALGLIPSLAAWALLLIETSLRVGGSSLYAAAPNFGADLYIFGIIGLSQGFLFTATLLTGTLVFVIEKRFLIAAGWLAVTSLLAFFGVIHGYELTEGGVLNRFGWMAAPEFAFGYAVSALALLGMFFLHGTNKEQTPEDG